MVTATSPRPAAPLPAPHGRQLAGTRPHRTWPRAAALLLTYPFRTSPFATQPFARSGRRQQQPPGPGRMVPAAPGERQALQAAAEETVDPGPVPHPTHLPKPEMAARCRQFLARPSPGGGARSRHGRGSPEAAPPTRRPCGGGMEGREPRGRRPIRRSRRRAPRRGLASHRRE